MAWIVYLCWSYQMKLYYSELLLFKTGLLFKRGSAGRTINPSNKVHLLPKRTVLERAAGVGSRSVTNVRQKRPMKAARAVPNWGKLAAVTTSGKKGRWECSAGRWLGGQAAKMARGYTVKEWFSTLQQDLTIFKQEAQGWIAELKNDQSKMGQRLNDDPEDSPSSLWWPLLCEWSSI